jgi:DNA-binding Lrp family transcriptional regulator
MPEAFVLFKTEPTHEREVYLALSSHEGVAEVHALYGEFDLLVRISSPNSKELSNADCGGGMKMAIGFVLMTTKPGQEGSVRSALENIDLVTNHWMLFGQYDLIARVQADEEYELTRCIVEEIRQLPGIQETKTLIGAEL